jgi:hypothetical protein
VQPFLYWKRNNYCILWVCVCSHGNPACSAYAPYFHLWPVWISYIFPNYLINGMIKKSSTDHKVCVLILSTTFFWNISLSVKSWVTYDQKCILVFRLSVCCYYCQILIKLDFSQQIFENCQIQNFVKFLQVGAETDRQTDRQTWWSLSSLYAVLQTSLNINTQRHMLQVTRKLCVKACGCAEHNSGTTALCQTQTNINIFWKHKNFS